MAAKARAYHSAPLSPKRELRLDEHGLRYSGPDQSLELNWSDVRALVPAAVKITPPDGEPEAIAVLGIVLRLPFARPVLVDGALPNLDYAIPIDHLGRRPLLGLTLSPADIVQCAADLARPAGVTLLPSEPWFR